MKQKKRIKEGLVPADVNSPSNTPVIATETNIPGSNENSPESN